MRVLHAIKRLGAVGTPWKHLDCASYPEELALCEADRPGRWKLNVDHLIPKAMRRMKSSAPIRQQEKSAYGSAVADWLPGVHHIAQDPYRSAG
jgi:hypothetical protein